MRLTIGLLIFMCVTTITVHLAVTKRIDGKLTIIFLAFAIVAGFVAANHDVVKRLKLNREGLEVETAEQEITQLNAASSQIALAVVRATYLSLETRNEFGSTPRLKKAVDEILQDLNRILPMVIPDPVQRAQWVEQLQNTLPKRE